MIDPVTGVKVGKEIFMGILDLWKKSEEKSDRVVVQPPQVPAQLMCPNDLALVALAAVAVVAVVALAVVVLRNSAGVA